MREYAFENAVYLIFSVLTLFMGIYFIGSKIIAWKSGEISLFIVPALEEYRGMHGSLPATTEPVPVKDILYVGDAKFSTLPTTLSIWNPKAEHFSGWYYHCPASLPRQLSTLTLIAPVLNERDIELTARFIKKFTQWEYEVKEIKGKKYLFFYTQAMCR